MATKKGVCAAALRLNNLRFMQGGAEKKMLQCFTSLIPIILDAFIFSVYSIPLTVVHQFDCKTLNVYSHKLASLH